jgi:hypothetical protein
VDGTPVWSHHGIVCTGETYKKVVKLTFARGPGSRPDGLFNSSLEGSTRRAIDIHEGRSSTRRVQGAREGAVARMARRRKAQEAVRSVAKPRETSLGGNPQIAKADGDAPVQAYIAAMPGWKRDVGSASTRSSRGTCPACARP